MSKVIVIDWGIFLHRAIFSLANNPDIPATYTCLSMVLGNLKRIGVDKDDKIIVAIDFLKSWRKEYEKEYKGDRKQKREDSGIDFKHWYKKFNELMEDLEISTNWHLIKVPHLEADDIMSVCCKKYSDQEVILVTYDSDLEQCWHYPNVKIFSPMSKKWKLKPKNFNVYAFISKKVEKEISDNLKDLVLNENDYQNRLVCVDLINLPDWIEKQVLEALESSEERVAYEECFPFTTLRNRYLTLYDDKSKIVDYQKQILNEEKKKLKKKESKKSGKSN